MAKSEIIFRANQWWGKFCSMASLRSNKYEVVRGIWSWKCIAVTNVLYRIDSIDWTADQIKKLDTIQNKVDRLGLDANRLVRTEAILRGYGWRSFEEWLFKGKLK